MNTWSLDVGNTDALDLGRPAAVALCVDTDSRAILGQCADFDRNTALAAALTKALSKGHKPTCIILDSAECPEVAAICAKAGIDMRRIPPYSPGQKGAVERMFRTFTPDVPA
jgi:hypothetical protein